MTDSSAVETITGEPRTAPATPPRDYLAEIAAAEQDLAQAKEDFDPSAVSAAKVRLDQARAAHADHLASQERQAEKEKRAAVAAALANVAPELADKLAGCKTLSDMARAALAEASRRAGIVDGQIGEIAAHCRVIFALHGATRALYPLLASELVDAQLSLHLVVGTRLRDAGAQNFKFNPMWSGTEPRWQQRQVEPSRIGKA